MELNSRVVYAEDPYAAVLEDKYVKSYCSNCFVNTPAYSCPKGCESIVYCTETCWRADWPWHEFECMGYRKLNKYNERPFLEARIRFVGRLASRLRVDRGVPATQKAGSKVGNYPAFPDYVKERTFTDLLSHYEDISNDSGSKKRLRSVVALFRKFYASTPLSTMSAEEIKTIFCTFRINSFCIPIGGGGLGTLGLGLYLNTSRFNHSCRPKGRVHFDGCRIVFKARAHVHSDEYNCQNRFDQLTLDYGVSTHASLGCHVSLTRQRVDSLKQRYFFRCLCEACADATAALVEERASAIECKTCEKPYVWTRSGHLESICQCQPTTATGKIDPKTRREVLKLDKRWKRVMTATENCRDKKKTLEFCEWLWFPAKRWWHPVHNLRLIQLGERLAQTLMEYWPDDDNENYDKKTLLQSRVHCLVNVAQQYNQISWTQHLVDSYMQRAKEMEQMAETAETFGHTKAT